MCLEVSLPFLQSLESKQRIQASLLIPFAQISRVQHGKSPMTVRSTQIRQPLACETFEYFKCTAFDNST